MSPKARREYVRETQIRYRRAQGRKDKSRIITEVRETLRLRHRKSAIRLLKRPLMEQSRRRREPIYPERLIDILVEIWRASLYPWSVRLKAVLPLWMEWIRKRWELSRKEAKQLLAMSPATMDRRLKRHKEKLGRLLYGKTKPGRFLKQSIPIHTEWHDVKEPGFEEVDTVSHSGPSAQGLFAYTVNQTDLFCGWTESRAILGKRAEDVEMAMEAMRQAVPFDEKGIDSDNGEEFINYTLARWCADHGLKRFRSRPNKKDDQAHIEQKNGTHVRRLIGWHRYDSEEAVEAMNSLYREERTWLTNLFLPSVRLDKKIRIGSRIKRVYDEAKTPLDRLIESRKGNGAKVEGFKKLRQRLDPFELSRRLDEKLEALWKLNAQTRIRPAPTDYVPKPRRTRPLLGYNPPGDLFMPHSNSDMARMRRMWWKDRFFGTN